MAFEYHFLDYLSHLTDFCYRRLYPVLSFQQAVARKASHILIWSMLSKGWLGDPREVGLSNALKTAYVCCTRQNS